MTWKNTFGKSFVLGMVLLGALLFSTVALTERAQAQENNQNVVIGASIIGILMPGEDDFADRFSLQLGITGLQQLYAEWYVLGRLGVGYRYLGTGITETYSTFGLEEKREIKSTSHLATANYLLYISTGQYTRLGVLGGIGTTNYTYTETINGISTQADTSGPTTLGQAYIDWGGEDFGARFGIGMLQTKLEEVKFQGIPHQADLSGNHWYFDLRWAFS